MLQFNYVGGSRKPTDHTIEKFMLFFVVGGKEMPFHELKKLGYVESVDTFTSTRESDRGEVRMISFKDIVQKRSSLYTTKHKYIKLFISEQGFGVRKRHTAFYFEISLTGNKIKITPFGGKSSPFSFEAIGRFLPKGEVKKIVTDENSLFFYSRQPKLPKEVIHELITIDKTHLQKNMRKIIVLKQEK